MITDISVQLVDHMGSDLSVANAARVSMAKESQWAIAFGPVGINPLTPSNKLSIADTKLLNYLAKHKHWTPFSHPQISFRIKAPIFVARQWFKHMVGITRNETSRRYVDDAPEFYLPAEWRMRPEGSIKQGSAGVHPDSAAWDETVGGILHVTVRLYNAMIADGVAPEQARMVLPQSMMTEWIETASLAAICRACALRLDPHAQAETRDVAERVAEIVAPLFPVSWSALMGVES